MDTSSDPETNKDSSTPKLTSIHEYEASVIEMSVDCWRLQKLFSKMAGKLDAGEHDRYRSQLRYFEKNTQDILARFGLKIVNLEGQPYDGGMAVIALNIAEFSPVDNLIIDQMTEPVIMGIAGLKKMGTVLLRRTK